MSTLFTCCWVNISSSGSLLFVQLFRKAKRCKKVSGLIFYCTPKCSFHSVKLVKPEKSQNYLETSSLQINDASITAALKWLVLLDPFCQKLASIHFPSIDLNITAKTFRCLYTYLIFLRRIILHSPFAIDSKPNRRCLWLNWNSVEHSQ